MFVTLQIERVRRYGTLSGLLDRLRAPVLSHELREVMGGRYLHVAWRDSRLPDWERIEEACARHRNRVLAPDELKLPGHLRLSAPETPRFDRMVMLKTACEIAARSQLPLYRRVLGIYDPGGEMSDMLESLLRYYSCVKVSTDALALYADESERMMREFGAPVLVGCETDSLADCMLVLVGSRFPPRPPAAPVLCSRGFPGGSPCISCLQITPPAEIAASCPPDISPHSFASALFEFSGVSDISFIATDMLCDYRRANFVETLGLILDHMERR